MAVHEEEYDDHAAKKTVITTSTDTPIKEYSVGFCNLTAVPEKEAENLVEVHQQQQQHQRKTDDNNNKVTYNRDWLIRLLQRHVNSLTNSPDYGTDGILRNKALVVAPMVDQSDLPFRLLCRRYGANLCYTPMIHARMFVNNEQGYKRKFWNVHLGTPEEDRPLIVQFAGGDPDILVRAAKLVQHQCDAIDINCGCPQSIAKRGNYGAYLLEQEELLLKCVRAVSEAVCVPVTVKVRLLPTGVQASIKLYIKLIDAGASMLTVHGRNRFQKGLLTGAADWDAIKQVVDACGHRIPIIANGSCASIHDVEDCLRFTGADGVMLSEAVLEYPPVFLRNSSSCETNECTTGEQQLQEQIIGIPPSTIRTGPGRLQLAREYMELCNTYPPNRGGQGSGTKCIKMHLHRFLHADLQESSLVLRDVACHAQTQEDMYMFIETVDAFQKQIGHEVKDEALSWYMRYRGDEKENNGVSNNDASVATDHSVASNVQLDDEVASFALCLFGMDDDASY